MFDDDEKPDPKPDPNRNPDPLDEVFATGTYSIPDIFFGISFSVFTSYPGISVGTPTASDGDGDGVIDEIVVTAPRNLLNIPFPEMTFGDFGLSNYTFFGIQAPIPIAPLCSIIDNGINPALDYLSQNFGLEFDLSSASSDLKVAVGVTALLLSQMAVSGTVITADSIVSSMDSFTSAYQHHVSDGGTPVYDLGVSQFLSVLGSSGSIVFADGLESSSSNTSELLGSSGDAQITIGGRTLSFGVSEISVETIFHELGHVFDFFSDPASPWEIYGDNGSDSISFPTMEHELLDAFSEALYSAGVGSEPVSNEVNAPNLPGEVGQILDFLADLIDAGICDIV